MLSLAQQARMIQGLPIVPRAKSIEDELEAPIILRAPLELNIQHQDRVLAPRLLTG